MKNPALFIVLVLAILIGAGVFAYNSMLENYGQPNRLAASAEGGAGNASDSENDDRGESDGGDVNYGDDSASDGDNVSDGDITSDNENEGESDSASDSASDSDNVNEGASDSASDGDDADERIPAPDFTVEDYDGNKIKFSDMIGKPVVVNFWASWCPPCKSEMPVFNDMYEEFGGDIHFMMIDAVDGSRETKKTGSKYISDKGYTFPVYYDVNQDALMKYGIRAFPTSIFIDSEGYVAAGVEGAIDEATLRRGIELIK